MGTAKPAVHSLLILTQRKQSKTPPFSLSFSDKSLKMLQKHSVEGFDDFKAKAEALAKEDVPLYVYFSGSKTSDGKAGVLIASLANLWLKQPLKKSLQSPLTICMLELEVEIFGRIQTVSSVAML